VRAESERVLRFIPQADVTALDPVWTSVYVTRNHGYMVFDTLYGQDSSFRVQPQMVEGATTDQDGLIWRLRLREGLLVSTTTPPVLARDCVRQHPPLGKARRVSGRRCWRRPTSSRLATTGTIVFRLKRPFPLLPDALGKMGINMLPIMPERLASTDPFKQVTEMVGSGPFQFVADERVVGAQRRLSSVRQVSPARARRPGLDDGSQDRPFRPYRVDRHPPTGATRPRQRCSAAMADWWEQPLFDLVPVLERSPELVDIGDRGHRQYRPLADEPAVCAVRQRRCQAGRCSAH